MAHPLRSLAASLLLALEDLAFHLLHRRPAPAARAALTPAVTWPAVTWHLPRDPFGRPN